jgi:hypothetical protein
LKAIKTCSFGASNIEMFESYQNLKKSMIFYVCGAELAKLRFAHSKSTISMHQTLRV